MLFHRLCAPALLIACCIIASAEAQSDIALKELAQRYWDAAMLHSPTRATALGDYRFNDRLEDLSEEGRKAWKASLRGLLRDLRMVPVAPLCPADRLTRDLLERTMRDELLRIECLGHYMPLDPLYGLHIRLGLLRVSQPLNTVADFRAYVSRLRGFSKQVADAIENMRFGSAIGFISPRVVVERVVPQIRNHLVSDVTQSVFYVSPEEAAVLGERDRETAVASVGEAIRSDVIPAYLRLLAYVEDEYLPITRSTVGLSSLPRGDKIYAALARMHTTVRLPTDDIHQLGLDEVARIRKEMAKVKSEVGFSGDLDAFLAHMRNDPRQRFESGAELLARSREILARTRPLMARLFGRLPKGDCVVKEIERFRQVSAPVAYYNLAPADGARPAYFYVNTYAPTQRLRFTLEALTYHEALPGHHLQMALDQENTSLPKFRRYARFTAYEEGWALYAEKLGYEIGGYTDPYARFGQLNFEMWRSCRLVVDTGIHAKGWSRQQAIDFITTNTSLAPIDIAAEVDRYITWPGQALAYKIGELRILRLRQEAQEAMGDRFDLRTFHDALLGSGAMPVDMLETRMRSWIAGQEG